MGAAFEGFFWPKILWDNFTHGLDGAVKPVPILQIINLVLGMFTFAFEFPLGIFTKTPLHRRIEARLVWIPLTATAVALLYQGPDSAGWYLIGMGAYFWAYAEGEVSPPICGLKFQTYQLTVSSGNLPGTLDAPQKTASHQSRSIESARPLSLDSFSAFPSILIAYKHFRRCCTITFSSH